MTLKVVTIKREVRKNLHNYSNYGESTDETVNRLIDEAGDITNIHPLLTGSTAIKITPETKQKLDELKLTSEESYSSVLERLIKKIHGFD
jgi:predicted CopG family antitoxin